MKVSAKTFEKIKGFSNHQDYSFGWVEMRYCGRCNDEIWHSVYLTKHKFNKSFSYMYPTKIGFYVCEKCGNYQRASND